MNRRKFLYSSAATTAVAMVPGMVPFLAGEALTRREVLATALILGAVAVVMWGGRSRLRDAN